MKANTRAYFRKSYEDFKKRPLFVTLFWIAIVAVPIMFVERLTSIDLRSDIGLLKEYFATTFLKEPVQSIFLFILIYPVAEELLYRGPIRLLDFLLTKTRLHLCIQTAVLAVTIVTQAHLWSSLHPSPMGFLLIGIILGVLVVKTQRWWVSAAVHIIINVLTLAGMLVSYWLF